MKNHYLPGLLLAVYCSSSLADTYYEGTHYSPYPPSCVSLPLNEPELYASHKARFFKGEMWLEQMRKQPGEGEQANFTKVLAQMYRVACSEPNRSVIVLSISMPSADQSGSGAVILPAVGGEGAMHYIPFELKAEPNGGMRHLRQEAMTLRAMGDYTGGWYGHSFTITWHYVLDLRTEARNWDPDFLVDYYNGSFALAFFRSDGEPFLHVDVPATADVLQAAPRLPLNGRLSGTWVEPGAADQGLLLSFSNPLPSAGSADGESPTRDLLVFLGWYTYDRDGRPLWLTGVARFEPGATETTVPLVRVANGQFLGGLPAERTPAGSMRLVAKGCDWLRADYDLQDLGLGAGRMRLQRLQALEIEGYPCRDHQARLAESSGQ